MTRRIRPRGIEAFSAADLSRIQKECYEIGRDYAKAIAVIEASTVCSLYVKPGGPSERVYPPEVKEEILEIRSQWAAAVRAHLAKYGLAETDLEKE